MPKRKNPNLAKITRHHTCHNTGALKAQTLRQLQQSLLQSYLLCKKLVPTTWASSESSAKQLLAVLQHHLVRAYPLALKALSCE